VDFDFWNPCFGGSLDDPAGIPSITIRLPELSSLRSPTLGAKGKDRSGPQIDLSFQAANEGIRHPFYLRMQGQSCFSRVCLEMTKATGKQELRLQLGGGAGGDAEEADVFGGTATLVTFGDVVGDGA